jgi:hypothetical protein
MTQADNRPADYDSYVAELPMTTLGVEHEYKWLLSDSAADIEPRGFLDRLGLPAGYTAVGRADITQSSIYFDDPEWGLAADGLSLAAILNHGWLKDLAWLLLKQTVLWEVGRRDTVEYGARIAPRRLAATLGNRRLLPLRELGRLGHGHRALDAYAVATQLRRKLDVLSPHDVLISLSFDGTTLKHPSPEQRELATLRWVEVECNQPDRRALHSLREVARAITGELATEPYDLTKPACAARCLGWRPGAAA